MVKLLFIPAIALMLSGCGIVNRWWGEEAPDRQVIVLEEGPGCPDPTLYFDGTDSEADEAIQCWSEKLETLWKTDTKEQGALTETEINTLIEKNVISLGGNKAQTMVRINAIRKLLGVENGVSKKQMDEWTVWFRAHGKGYRDNKRTFGKWMSPDGYPTGKYHLSYENLKAGAATASAFLRRIPWEMTSAELVATTRPFWTIELSKLENSLVEVAEVLLDTLGTFCPRVGERDRWNPSALADCLDAMLPHFEKGAAWVEALANPYSPLSPHPDRIVRALDDLSPLVTSWFSQAGLSQAETRRWIALAKSLDLSVNESSLDSISWIHRFNSKSDSYNIDPSVIPQAFELFREAQKHVLKNLQSFSHCDFTRPDHWSKCQFRKSSNQSEKLGFALRVRNLKYGERAAPLSRNLFSKIMLFDLISQKIIDEFDDKLNGKQGWITVKYSDEPEELLKILEMAFQLQKNTEFAEEIAQRLRGHVPPPGRDDFLRQYDKRKITRLVTLMGDILVKPDKTEVDALEDFFKILRLKSKKGALFLDHLRLTAVITTVESLSGFRAAYIETDEQALNIPLPVERTERGSAIVSRQSILDAIPGILKEHFPRLYQSCNAFDYRKSCKIVFEELVPGVRPDDFIYASDLDVVTLTAIYGESLMDYCDRNMDGVLKGGGFFRGNDELDCSFNQLRNASLRLMDAGVIEDSGPARRTLRLLDLFFLTRTAAKIALDKGKKNILGWKLPFQVWNQKADIGSIFGLAADIIQGKTIPEDPKEKKN